MTSVDQYIAQLSSIESSVISGQKSLERLEKEHAKKLSEIDKRYRVCAQDSTNSKNADVDRAKDQRKKREREISDYLRQVDEYDKRIPSRLRKGVTVDQVRVEPKDNDWASLDLMAQRICDDTLWGKVKGVLNVYGYYSRKEMVRDYLLMLENSRALARQEMNTARKVCQSAQDNATQRMNSTIQQAEQKKKKEHSEEQARYLQEKGRLESSVAKALEPGRFSSLATDLSRDSSSLLIGKRAFDKVTLPDKPRDAVLVGYVFFDFQIGASYKKQVEAGLRSFCKYPKVRIPYSVSTKGSFSIVIETPSSRRAEVVSGVRSIMARAIASYPFEELEISFIDPIDRGTSLERFEQLATADDCSAVRPPAASEKNIEQELERLEKTVDSLSLKLATVGTIDDYNAVHEEKQPHRLLIINDYPNGFSRRSLESLKVLINNGEKCGISFLFIHNKADKLERENEETFSTVKASSMVIDATDSGCTIAYRGKSMGFALSPSKPIPDAFFSEVAKQYSEGSVIDNSFSRLCDFNKPIAYEESTKGLQIPFAVNRSNDIVCLELGTSTAAHMVITGTTGSGKSTTLHAIIAGTMLRYHPQDVEIWLVDYKETEFAEYTLNPFPHVRLIGLDKSKEFTFALVDKIYDEMTSRASFLASEHYQSLSDYKADPIHGPRSIPRIVIIIDEFHNLAQTIKDDPEYVTKFENILAESRTSGLSLVLSDQSILEGLRGLTEKGKKQLTSRIAMRNTTDEIRGTLDLDSSLFTEEVRAKTKALVSGDVVLKKEVASPDGYDVDVVVEKYKTLFVRQEDRTKLVPYIASNTQGLQFDQPLVVDGQKRQKFSKTAIQEYELHADEARPGERYLYLGTPSTFESCFRILLKRQLGQNIALLGQETERRASILLYAIRSFTRSKECKAVIVAHPEDSLYDQYKGLFRKIAGPRIVVVDDLEEVCEEISSLCHQVRSGKKEDVLLVLLGYELLNDEFELLPPKAGEEPSAAQQSGMSAIDAMMAQMGIGGDAETSAPSSDSNDTSAYDARDNIGEIVTKGSKFGVHTMLSLEKPNALRRIRCFKLDSFDHRISLQISADESLDYFGSSQAAKGLDSISALYSDSGLEIKVFRPYLLPGRERKG